MPDLRVHAGPRPAGQQDQGAQAPQQSAPRPGARRRGDDRPVHRRAVPRRALDPGRDGHRPADTGRDRRAYRRLQVRPHAGRRQAVRLPHARAAWPGRRDLPAVRLHPRRESRLHPVRADRGRSLPRHHARPRRAGHRGDVRQQHRAHPAGPGRVGDLRPQRGGHRPVDGAEHAHRVRAGLPEIRPDTDGVQGQDQRGPRRQAHDRDHRRPGRAHVGPGADGQSRSPLRGDPAGRYGHRQRQPHPGQRGVRRAHDRQPVQGRRERPATTRSAGRMSRATAARKSSSSCWA